MFYQETSEFDSEIKMPIEIIEKYISPWALPRELVVGRIGWIPCEDVRRIHIRCPKESETELPNVSKWEKNRNSLIFDVEELELADKFTFISKINPIPKKVQTKKEFAICFLDENNDLLGKETLQTRIIRPMLVVENISPKRIRLAKDHAEALIKLELKAKGWGDILKVRPEVQADAYFLEIIQFKPAFITDANPFLEVNVEEYLDRIIAKRAGKTKLSIAFAYEDRIGNVYKTDATSIAFSIQHIIGAPPEVFVENKVSLGKEERIILPERGMPVWPLVA